MRFLIVASVLACASAVPLAPHGVLTPTLPTISAGDINGAAIEAHVEAADHVRAAVDKVNELHGQAINNAEESAWKAVDDVKTIEARWDGAAASAARVIAKQIVGRVAPVVAAPVAAAPIAAAPVAAAPVAAAPVAAASYSAPVVASYDSSPYVASPYDSSPYVASPYAAAPYAAPYAAAHYAAAPYSEISYDAAPYSAYPLESNVVSPYYGSHLGY